MMAGVTLARATRSIGLSEALSYVARCDTLAHMGGLRSTPMLRAAHASVTPAIIRPTIPYMANV